MGDRPVLVGLLLYVAIAVAPTVVLWLGLRALPAAVAAFFARRRRTDPAPGPCLESVVATLRRLHRQVRDSRPPTQVRTVALLAAYDETLLEVCAMVGVEAPLAEARRGDRAFARLLTEAALEDAGIALDPPG
ncbi:hypothetical protein ACU61A_21465 [Pseudonocardia sichuanensis]|uniref:Uncharacterized protein n=1 Tax=Pseudonocardia kunmingensis TaxID=630975 RepID=A0A543DNB9_9PSEU|nr:hypothetical protein [Pseudonocardia kunmingensis]TQM10831.1 hypothetical protein FB558_3353 [Pseudonocardia kunmingensis]